MVFYFGIEDWRIVFNHCPATRCMEYMHYHTLCLCSHSARTVARCKWFNSKVQSSLGGIFSRCHLVYPSFQLQAPSQEPKNGFHHLDRTDSILHGLSSEQLSSEQLSSEVDKELQELLTVKEEEAKDVFIDDLSATLEAHRATNRAAIVRKQNQKADEGSLGFKRPLIGPKIIPENTPAEDVSTLLMEQGAEVAPKPLGTSTTDGNTNDDGTDPHGDESRAATEATTEPIAVSDKQKVEKPGGNGLRSTKWPADSIQNQRRQGKRYSISPHEVLEYDAMYIPPGGDYSTRFKPSCPWLANLGPFTSKRKATASRR